MKREELDSEKSGHLLFMMQSPSVKLHLKNANFSYYFCSLNSRPTQKSYLCLVFYAIKTKGCN